MVFCLMFCVMFCQCDALPGLCQQWYQTPWETAAAIQPQHHPTQQRLQLILKQCLQMTPKQQQLLLVILIQLVQQHISQEP
jgi:hypothetical protein